MCGWRASSQLRRYGYGRDVPRTSTGCSACASENPVGLGKLCQAHCAWIMSGTRGEDCSWNVCRPVMSAVKPRLPLPTISGDAGSMRVSVGLCRVTSARRSMRVALAWPND